MIDVRRIVSATGLLAALSVGVGNAPAGSSLGIAGNYGEFVFGDSTRHDTDSRGPVAVGGNANFTNFGVATDETGSASSEYSVPNTLVVEGDLSWTNGQLHTGTGVVTGAINTQGVGGSISTGTSPIDFAAVRSDLLALSAAQYDSSAAFVSRQYSSLTLGDSSASGLQVVNVQGDDIAASSEFFLKGGTGSTLIINVVGDVSNWAGNVILDTTLTSSHVLWNFVDAASVSINGIGIQGTVLAAGSNVAFNSGQLNGSLIAAELIGQGETHIDQGGTGGEDTRFTGELVPSGVVPEPASLAMLGSAAVVGLAVAARRRAAR